jgi:hypothetical protein
MMNPMMNPMNMFLTPANSGCGCKGPANHKVPRMPIMIDQVKADPRDVRAFLGKPLHTVADADAFDGKMLQIFTSKETAKEFARSTALAAKKKQSRTPRPTLTDGVPPDGGYIELFEHIDFDGCSWYVPEPYHNHTVPNYGDLWCGILWWAKNANNTVSSIDVLVSADLVQFFDLENINPSGSSITFPGDSWITSLVPWGWNDRISSHLLWYLS